MDEIISSHFASSGMFVTGFVAFVTYVDEDGVPGWDFFAPDGQQLTESLGMSAMMGKCVDLMLNAHLTEAYGLDGPGSDD